MFILAEPAEAAEGPSSGVEGKLYWYSADPAIDLNAAIAGLTAQVASLQRQSATNVKDVNYTSATNMVDLDEEDKSTLLTNSRSIQKILRLIPDLMQVDTGLQCGVCASLFTYNSDLDGESFDPTESEPRK